MLNDKEKEQLVEKLLDERKSYRDIMRIVQVSPSTIKKVRVQLIRASTPVDKSDRLKAFEIFDSQNPRGCNVYQVVSELDILVEDAEKYQTEYLKLNHRDELALTLQDKNLFGFIPIYREMQSRGLTVNNLRNALGLSTSVANMEVRYQYLSTEIRSAENRMIRLNNEIAALDRQGNALKKENASLANLNEILKQQVSSSQQAIDKFRSSDLVPIAGIVNAIGRSMLEDRNLLLGAAAASIVKTLASDPIRVSVLCNPAAVAIFVSFLLDPGPSGNENELYKLARSMLGIYSDFLVKGILEGTIKAIADSNYKNDGERSRAVIGHLAILYKYSPFLASLLTHQ
jgi:cell division protein FtsB